MWNDPRHLWWYNQTIPWYAGTCVVKFMYLSLKINANSKIGSVNGEYKPDHWMQQLLRWPLLQISETAENAILVSLPYQSGFLLYSLKSLN